MVVYSHSFPLANNSSHLGIFKMSYGNLGVFIFFVISGFLITQSYDKTQNLLTFTKARILRIFPALAVVLLLSSFLLGPLLTTLSLSDYFSHPQTYRYLETVFLYPISYELPGVFESNPFKMAVNGSLWTLQHEFSCYVLVGILGFCGLLKYRAIFVLVFLITFLPTDIHFLKNPDFIKFLRYFSAGMIMYGFKLPFNWKLALVAVGLLITTQDTLFDSIFPLVGAYLIMYIAFNPRLKLFNFAKFGDFSYGMYIYAFPVQQTMTHLTGDITPITNFLLSFPITLVLAVLSWHLIEKRFLALKKTGSAPVKHTPYIKAKPTTFE